MESVYILKRQQNSSATSTLSPKTPSIEAVHEMLDEACLPSGVGGAAHCNDNIIIAIVAISLRQHGISARVNFCAASIYRAYLKSSKGVKHIAKQHRQQSCNGREGRMRSRSGEARQQPQAIINDNQWREGGDVATIKIISAPIRQINSRTHEKLKHLARNYLAYRREKQC